MLDKWNDRLFYILLAVLLILSLTISRTYSISWDISENNQNSLHEESKILLGNLQGAISLTAFLPDLPVQRANVKHLTDRYQHIYPDIAVEFVDPSARPEYARKLGITRSGEMLVEYAGKSEKIRAINEQSISNAIARLSLDAKGWIVALEGHGESDLYGNANFDLSNLNKRLKSIGYKTVNQNSGVTGQLPANTDLLLVAAPRSSISEAEQNQLLLYLEQGGNMLWLGENDIPEKIADYFGLYIRPGTVVDAAAASLGIETPTIAVANKYPEHEITQHLKGPVLLPQSIAMAIIGNQHQWQAEVLLQTGARSWNETGSFTGTISRDNSLDEVQGPLDLAYAFTRSSGEKLQKAIFVGDADFVSNAYIGNGENPNFALAAIHWLTSNEHLVQIPAATAADLQMHRTPTESAVIAFVFLIAIPALLVILGTGIYYRRRRI